MTDETEAVLVGPEQFLASDRRLFIDTNVFMDTDEQRATALRLLFERCKDIAVTSNNGIIVPTKVIDELRKQSRINTDELTSERAAAVQRAGRWLTALESASSVGLVRSDLGDDTNPYADDLFVEVFTRAATRYEMCLVTNDITLRLRIRLLAEEKRALLVAGVLVDDGLLRIDPDQELFQRATRKLERIRRGIAEGAGTPKDLKEVESLAPLVTRFSEQFDVKLTHAHAKNVSSKTYVKRGQPFSVVSELKPLDRQLEEIDPVGPGDEVFSATNVSQGSRLVLGDALGEGGEGRIYSVIDDPRIAVKVFDRAHRTRHRQEKITLLLSRGFERAGVAFPTSVVTDRDGAFIGYSMPMATGTVLQTTVMSPARFQKAYPSWRRADLVDVCVAFLRQVSFLHSKNILLGDINPKNLMVDESKSVWIIDADSWQIEGYPCPVGTPMFTGSSESRV